jgi:catechol 2,3-dioxygenase-like lactoylglutathione lyase family enzyme
VTTRETIPIPIAGMAHIGIRVHDLERCVAFYALLGFRKTAGPIGPEPVAILDHPSGVEINLVLNAPKAHEPDVLMSPRSIRESLTSRYCAPTSWL